MTKPKKLLTIHGFNSSPQSHKAQLTKQYFNKHYPDIEVVSPQLLSDPNAVIKQLSDIIEQSPNSDWYLTGSSLGGYFATYLVAKYNLPAALINPAVKPYEIFDGVIGEQTNPYTGEVYQVTHHQMDTLKLIEQQQINKNNFFVMVQTGDEVLNYQEAVEKYRHCLLEIQQGGDHSFLGFELMLPQIARFFKLPDNA